MTTNKKEANECSFSNKSPNYTLKELEYYLHSDIVAMVLKYVDQCVNYSTIVRDYFGSSLLVLPTSLSPIAKVEDEQKQKLFDQICMFGVDFSQYGLDYDNLIINDFELFKVCLLKFPTFYFWRKVLNASQTLEKQREFFFKQLKQKGTLKDVKVLWAHLLNEFPESKPLFEEFKTITKAFVDSIFAHLSDFLTVKDVALIAFEYVEKNSLNDLLFLTNRRFKISSEKQKVLDEKNNNNNKNNNDNDIKTIVFQPRFFGDTSTTLALETIPYLIPKENVSVQSSSQYRWFAPDFNCNNILEKDPLDLPPPLTIDWTNVLTIPFPKITSLDELNLHREFLLNNFRFVINKSFSCDVVIYPYGNHFQAFNQDMIFKKGQIVTKKHSDSFDDTIVANSFEEFIFRCHLIYWNSYNEALIRLKSFNKAILKYRDWQEKINKRKKNNFGFSIDL
jgi:hypothetical protein